MTKQDNKEKACELDTNNSLIEINKAINNHSFVPICGFEIASDEHYNTIPTSLKNNADIINSLGQNPPVIFAEQETVIARLDKIKCYIHSLKKKYETAKSDIENPINASRAEKKIYYNKLESYIGKYIPGFTELKINNDWTISLLTNLLELSFSLTMIWTEIYQNDPSPLGAHFIKSKRKTGLGSDSVYRKGAIKSIRKALNCCAFRYSLTGEQSTKDNTTEDLSNLKWIYRKLLKLASEVFEEKELWDEENPCVITDNDILTNDNPCMESCLRKSDNNCKYKMSNSSMNFVKLHHIFIRDSENADTNWTTNNRDIERVKGDGHSVELAHIQWLQKLIRHLLYHDTRCYRTRGQIAFMLSLDDCVHGLIGETSDPFEIGSLNSKQDHNLLKNILKFCEGKGKGEHPQPFFWALARRFKIARDADPGSDDGKEQIILSMSLDRELERAICYEFKKFRIIMPVNIIKQDFETENSEEETTVWIVATCTKDNESSCGYTIKKWSLFDSTVKDTFSLKFNGPLIVELFGAPMEKLPDLDYMNTDHAEDFYDDEEEVTMINHRVILDESSLWTSLDDTKSLPSQVKTRIHSSLLCFFGQNAVRWSERLPFYKLNSYYSETKKKSLVISNQYGDFGKSIFERLKIDHNNQPDEIIKSFLYEAIEEPMP